MPEEILERTIEIRSEEIDEILGRTPSWILRRGILLLSVIVLVLLIFSWFFQYPDVITAPVTITSVNPPIAVSARSGGRIIAFFANEKQHVKTGDYLAIIENSADTASISKLRFFFRHADTLNKAIHYLSTDSIKLSGLGDLQQPYNSFIQAVINFQRYELLSFNAKKIEALKTQIRLTNLYIEKLKGQRYLQGMNLKLARKQFSRDSLLFAQQVIPASEFDKAETQLIINKTSYKNAEMALSNSQIQVNQLEQQVIELHLTIENESKQLIDEVNNSYKILRSRFDEWEKQFVLRSTSNGIVSIGNYWSVNQNVKVGDIVMSIIPEKEDMPYGRLTIGMENSGKVKQGQTVNIKLSNFNYNEFGMLTGKVKSISLVPDQSKYYIEVELTNGLRTNYNKQLPFLHEMSGTGEIITEDMRLIERIIGPIRTLIKERIVSD